MQEQLSYIRTHSAQEILEKYGIVVEDIQIQNTTDQVLANNYPNIFSLKYQNTYTTTLLDNENYIVFDITTGLQFDDQLVKYNITTIDPSNIVENIEQYKILKFSPQKKSIKQKPYKIITNNKSSKLYYVALQYDSNSYRISQLPLTKDEIISPIILRQLVSIDESTEVISELIDQNFDSEKADKYLYQTDFTKQHFDTIFDRIVRHNIQKNESDHISKRLWYNIGLFLEQVE